MRKNSFTMGAVKPWKRMVYLLTPMFTEFVRICLWWRTSPDLIAVPAFRRMTCPGCVALWFKWDGGESLPSSDLPKAVERSFLFLQLRVQSDKQYNLIWIFFCLFVFGIIWRMMMKEPQQSLSLGAVAKLTQFLESLLPKGKYPQILQAVLHREYKRGFI